MWFCVEPHGLLYNAKLTQACVLYSDRGLLQMCCNFPAFSEYCGKRKMLHKYPEHFLTIICLDRVIMREDDLWVMGYWAWLMTTQRVGQMHDVFFWCVCVCVPSVELPFDDDSMEAGSSTRLWKHCCPQTLWTDTAHLPLHGRAHQGGKLFNPRTHNHVISVVHLYWYD